MATKAETFKANEQQTNHVPEVPRDQRMHPRVAEDGTVHDNVHAGEKAVCAMEEHVAGTTPSRKSTRGSANHARPDVQLAHKAEMELNSPERRHDKA